MLLFVLLSTLAALGVYLAHQVRTHGGWQPALTANQQRATTTWHNLSRATQDWLARQEAKQQETAEAAVNPHLVCPHCQQTGRVSVREETVAADSKTRRKMGLAVLTGGTSVLATGTGKWVKRNRYECLNCTEVWHR